MKPAIAVPAIAALVYRAWSRKSLTPLGIATALLTAVAHAVHPYSVCFALLAVFFLLGTAVTKVNTHIYLHIARMRTDSTQVKHDIKSRLTQSSTGSSGGEGPRTHIQVLANSLFASVLILLDTYRLHQSGAYSDPNLCCPPCWHRRQLRCCSRGHVLFGTWHTGEGEAEIDHGAVACCTAGHEWWGYGDGAGRGIVGGVCYCEYGDAVASVLQGVECCG